ncbi:uncharacterized protein [Amphiura filiformis]|uniref:uncharacterized protein n=1 Tax=Amphiura filiformis TaxID=82378 RepID=UPI003B221B49
MSKHLIVMLTTLGFITMVTSHVTPTGTSQTATQEQAESCNCPPYHPVYIPAGVQGPQGLTGPAGDPGIPGVPGQPGQPGQGLKGEQGQGLPGSKGDQGQKGDIGPVGEPGLLGSPGKMGPVGIPGLSGVKGQPGIDGARGQPGTDGVGGQPGTDGVKGQKGEAGTSSTSYTPPSTQTSAFSAQLKRDLTGSQTITFDVEDLDIGNDFDHTTGIFTCRITGLYFFTFSFAKWETSIADVSLRVNGVRKAWISIDVADAREMQSQSVVLMLQQGDEVKLVTAGDMANYSDANINLFNGFLIHAT